MFGAQSAKGHRFAKKKRKQKKKKKKKEKKKEKKSSTKNRCQNNRGFSAGMHLDEFSLVDVLQRRAHVMRYVLHTMREVYASPVAACEEIVAAHAVMDMLTLGNFFFFPECC